MKKSLFLPAGPAEPEAVCDAAAAAVCGRERRRFEGGEPVRHRAAARQGGPTLPLPLFGRHVPAADVIQGIQRAAGREQGSSESLSSTFLVQGDPSG